jgi:TPR repeat protein
MLLRGDRVNKFADNVSPAEARGEIPLIQRENEEDRARRANEAYVIKRDPPRARDLLEKACDTGAHVTSCHNLAVMYSQGDEGVEANETKAAYYRTKTQQQVDIFGGF